MTLRLAIASAWLFASCTPQTDVVAYQPESDASDEAFLPVETGPPETAPPPFPCDPLAVSAIVAYRKDGVLFAYDPVATSFTTLGPTACPVQSLMGMALRADATVWLLDVTGQVFVTAPNRLNQQCQAITLNLKPPSVATFLLVGTGESLYAVTGDNVLVAIDPTSQVRSPVGLFPLGPLAALTGTWDGRLEAMTPSPPGVMVFTVSPGDASVQSKVYFELDPDAGVPSILTAATWGDDLYVFDDHQVYDYRPAAGQVASRVPIPPQMLGITGVASSVCATRPK